MSFGLAGSTRYSALATLLLALGFSCATSEEPSPDYSPGGRVSQAGGPMAGSPAAGSPAAGGNPGVSGSPGQGGARPEAGMTGRGGASAGAASGGSPGAAGKANSAGSGGAPKAGSGSGGGAGTMAMGGMAGDGSAGSSGSPPSGGTGGGAGAGGEPGTGTEGCDWTGSACMAKSCMSACPTTDGGDCANRCGGLITCIQDALDETDCATEADPMCVTRGMNGVSNECTMAWETAGGSTTSAGPSKVATEYFECACDTEVR